MPKYLHSFLFRHRFIRFLVSGGTATFVQLAGIYFLHGVFGIGYLVSSSIAFICAVTVNFILQKLWAFGNYTKQGMYRQGIFFLSINCVNLIVNIAILYILVDMFGVFYFFAQIIACMVVAVISFFAYRLLFAPLNIAMTKV